MDLNERVSKLEEKTQTHDKRITSFETKMERIPRLETLMELVVETNKKQSDTLDKINKNLTYLNGKMENLDSRVGELEEGKKELKKASTDIIVKVVGGILLAAFLLWLGFSK